MDRRVMNEQADRRTMNEQTEESIRRLARELRRHGLATPALMVVDVVAPFSFVGEQLLYIFGPLFPFRAWRKAAHELIMTLRDDGRRNLLQRLLRE